MLESAKYHTDKGNSICKAKRMFTIADYLAYLFQIKKPFLC